MTKVLELEQAVAELAPDDLAAFRAWFDAFDSARFDERIQTDALSGRLDALAEEAASDVRRGQAREL